MALASDSNSLTIGRISEGPDVSLVERTLQFVYEQLGPWRSDPDRPLEDSEELLNAQLCKYLNAVASERFPMVLFSHEESRRELDALISLRIPAVALLSVRLIIRSMSLFSPLKASDSPGPQRLANENM